MNTQHVASEQDGIFYLRRDEISFDVTDEEWDYITAKAARAVMEAIQNVTGNVKTEDGNSTNPEALRSDEDSI